MIVNEDLHHALARGLAEWIIAAMNVSDEGLNKSIMNFWYVEQMEDLGESVQECCVLSPQGHHSANCLVIVFQLGEEILIDELALVFR